MKRIVVWCCLAVFVSGCAGIGARLRARYPNAVTPDAKASFNAADALYMAKRFSEADKAFEKFISSYPYTELTDESRFRRGEITFAQKKYAEAVVLYRQAYSDIVSPAVAPKAMFKASLAFSRQNLPREALDEIKKIVRRDASAILRMRMDSLGMRASKELGDPLNTSVVWALLLLDDYSDAAGVLPSGIPPNELVSEADALAQARQWVGDKTITGADIDMLPLKGMKGKRSGGFAAYKRALVLHSSGDTKAATAVLKSFLSTYPKHEYYGAARLLASELGGVVGEGAGVTIGVLLPLSGKYATYGDSTLHGIECAVGIYEPCVGPAGIKLVVRDSESAEGGIAGAVDALAGKDVIAIVGPLLSGGADEGARRAQELGIPLVSLSQRDGIAEIGEFVFRNSVSDPSEMATLAEYAVERMKLRRFFILYPPGKKSAEYKSLFTDAVRSLGGSVVAAELYSPEKRESGDELRGRGMGDDTARMGTGGEEIIDFSAGGADYDAVFIPDSISVASYMANKLAMNRNKKVQLFGVSRWDDQRIVDRAGAAVEGAVFVDSFYKQAPDENVSAFVSRFRDAYGSEPTLLEALGYDATRLVINAVQEKGAVKRESVRDALARTSGFPGVSGKITFDSEGDAKRELWVLKISGGTIGPAK